MRNEGISLTALADNWLKQFEPPEVNTVIRILTSLHMVSNNRFLTSLTNQVQQISDSSDSPIGLYAIREIPKDSQSTIADKHHYFGNPLSLNSQPIALDGSDGYGSEAIIAKFITALARQNRKNSKDRFWDHPSLENLKTHQIRKVILIDDMSGSGERAAEFYKHFKSHPTMLSWLSLGLIEIHLVFYAISTMAKSELCKLQRSTHVHFEQSMPSFKSMGWSAAEVDDIMNLCKKYPSTKKSLQKMALGYRKNMGLLIFQHGCPNNVPSFLWQSDPPRYNALFKGRSIQSQFYDVFTDYPSSSNFIRRMNFAEQSRLQSAIEITHKDSLVLLLFLKNITRIKGLRKNIYMVTSELTGLTVNECRLLRKQCLEWGLITKNHQLTEEGLNELSIARKLVKEASAPNRRVQHYYPTSLNIQERI